MAATARQAIIRVVRFISFPQSIGHRWTFVILHRRRGPMDDGAASLPVGCDWKQTAAHGRQDVHPVRERLEVVNLDTGNRCEAVTRRRDRSSENHGTGRMQVPHQGERRAARRR